MTRTRVLTALVAALTVAGVGTATVALAAPAAAPAVVRAAQPAPAVAPPGPAPAGATADDARRIATDRLGGGTVTKVERDVEHGRDTWEVDVLRGAAVTEVHVDTANGTVSRIDGSHDRGDDHGGAPAGEHGDDRGDD